MRELQLVLQSLDRIAIPNRLPTSLLVAFRSSPFGEFEGDDLLLRFVEFVGEVGEGGVASCVGSEAFHFSSFVLQRDLRLE